MIGLPHPLIPPELETRRARFRAGLQNVVITIALLTIGALLFVGFPS